MYDRDMSDFHMCLTWDIHVCNICVHTQKDYNSLYCGGLDRPAASLRCVCKSPSELEKGADLSRINQDSNWPRPMKTDGYFKLTEGLYVGLACVGRRKLR